VGGRWADAAGDTGRTVGVLTRTSHHTLTKCQKSGGKFAILVGAFVSGICRGEVPGEQLDATPQPNDRFHLGVDGDRIDLLAYQSLGDSTLWWVIGDVNDLALPLDLPVGATLRIPSRSGCCWSGWTKRGET
jgi:hypothetical protein